MIRKSGGLGVFVKNEILPFVEELTTGSEYVLWVKIAKSYILMMIKTFYLVVHIYHIEGLAQNYCIYNFKIFQEIEKTAQFS